MNREEKLDLENKQLIDSYKKKLNVVKLDHITNLDSFSIEVKSWLNACYSDGDSTWNRMGSIWNAVFTSQNPTFIITSRIVADLIGKDPNIELKNCNGPSYARLMKILFENGFIEEVRPQVGRTAGLYTIKDERIKNMLIREMGRELYSTINDAHLKWYDENIKTAGLIENRHKEVKEYYDKALRKRKINGRRNLS